MSKKQNDMSSKSKKLIKQLIRESKPEPFVIDGRVVYFNPLKKLLEGEAYKTLDGVAVTQEMVKKYEQFLKTRFTQDNFIETIDFDYLEIHVIEED